MPEPIILGRTAYYEHPAPRPDAHGGGCLGCEFVADDWLCEGSKSASEAVFGRKQTCVTRHVIYKREAPCAQSK